MAQDRPRKNRAAGAGHQSLGGLYENDVLSVFARAVSNARIVPRNTGHAARRVDQELGTDSEPIVVRFVRGKESP